MRGHGRPAWRRLLVLALAFVAVTEFVTPVRAWNERGHKLVAFIAYQHLTEQAKATVHALLKLNPQFPDLLMDDVPPNATDERIRTTAFIQAATWPDFIKTAHNYSNDGSNSGYTPPNTPEASQIIGYQDFNRHKYWHFISVPFSDDGTPTVAAPSVNAKSQVELLRAALGSPTTAAEARSYSLVWLIHLVGDVHQPLHAVARFTSNDAHGDAGGHHVTVNCPATLTCEDTLHQQWDHLLGDGGSFNKIKSAAISIDSGPAPTGANITDVGVWIDESVSLAKSHVYKTTDGGRLGSPQAALTPGYLNRAKDDARSRVRLAGRRLAKLINDALGTRPSYCSLDRNCLTESQQDSTNAR
jgi:hypothetical protein